MLKKFFEDKNLSKFILFFILILAIIFSTLLTGGDFLSPRNLTNLTRQISINGMLSLGMTLVILTGGIDLSLGSVVALSGVVAALMQTKAGFADLNYVGSILSVFAAIITGTICGAINGALIVKSKVAPFIITLGIMVISRGIALIISDGTAIAPLSEQFNFLGQGYLSIQASTIFLLVITIILSLKLIIRKKYINFFSIFLILIVSGYSFLRYRGIPIPVVFLALLTFAMNYLLERTIFGRYVIASGSNPEAAFLSGLPLKRITFFVYLLMGFFSGFSGSILAARLNGAMPTAGELFELDAIAAVVIGGTRLTGGSGSIGGSILGALLIGILNNSMSLLNVTEFYQKVFKGCIIIAAVWIAKILDKKST